MTALALATLAAIAGWFAILVAIPTLESDRLWRAMLKGGMRLNALTPARITRAPRDLVPLSNADMVTRAMIYDLDNGPLLVEADIPADLEYWSVSVFARNTDTIFVANDQAVGKGRLRLLVRLKRQPADPSADAEIISPSARGFLLVRAVTRDRSDASNVTRTIERIAGDRIVVEPASR